MRHLQFYETFHKGQCAFLPPVLLASPLRTVFRAGVGPSAATARNMQECAIFMAGERVTGRPGSLPSRTPRALALCRSTALPTGGGGSRHGGEGTGGRPGLRTLPGDPRPLQEDHSARPDRTQPPDKPAV